MKHQHQHQYHHGQNQHPVNAPLSTAVAEPKQGGIDFSPADGEIAKRAYSIFINQGSRPGCDIQHWQEAEAQLVEERNRTLDRGLPKSLKK